QNTTRGILAEYIVAALLGIENKVRKNLKVPVYDIYKETPPTPDEIKRSESISDELKSFEEYFQS
ncbi:MAG: hypothetical protein ACFE9R_16440, partial [Candidatus Hermodarchaeota archaeon]